ncbi:NlpC/P60 family protein [Burkholderia cenocepacia]|uniref:NlpC/P60 family protein n=1 Tax=Burkholderia cenocepacia TaxID=95486 RepID=UPI002650A03A|nr:NlpC/P60 family protein [Burkholderia cenocepacia]MDN7456603.1 NlpC/P60 family protein [Burkholderia cenocepacia]
MATRDQIVAEARSWLGTPYRHQGRLKGVSVDCAGLVVGVAQALGLPALDMSGYARRPDGSLRDFVHGQTEAVAPGAQQGGDIVIFQWQNAPVHLALLTAPDCIIHAFAINREVCEHGIDEKWLLNIVGYRKFSGVE